MLTLADFENIYIGHLLNAFNLEEFRRLHDLNVRQTSMNLKEITPEEMCRFENMYQADPNSGCWLWTASVTNWGYGQIRFRSQMMLAHRHSYELHKGPIPDGLQIDHLCRNTYCVNPDHLEAVSASENQRRSHAFGMRSKPQVEPKSHCQKGHALSENNVLINSRGHRYCRACRQDSLKRYAAKRAAHRASALQPTDSGEANE